MDIKLTSNMDSYTVANNKVVGWSGTQTSYQYCQGNVNNTGWFWNNSTKMAPWNWNTAVTPYGYNLQQYWCIEYNYFQLDSMQYEDGSWLIVWRLRGTFRDYWSGAFTNLGVGDFETNWWSYSPMPMGVPSGGKYPLPGFAGWDFSIFYIYLKWNQFRPNPGVTNIALFNTNGVAKLNTNPLWVYPPSFNPIVLVPSPTAVVPITPSLVIGDPEPGTVIPPVAEAPVAAPVAAPVTVVVPIEVPVSIPVEEPVAAPVAVPVEVPVTIPVEAPVTIPVTIPVEVPVTIPVEAPVPVPVAVPVPVPVDAPVPVPVAPVPVPVPVDAPTPVPVAPVPVPVPVDAPTPVPVAPVPVPVPVDAPVPVPVAPVPVPVPVSIPISAPINTPTAAPVTAPVAAPGVAGTCNITGTASQCRYFPGWHGLDCGCELRPVMDCTENVGGNTWKVWWGYKVWCRDGCRRPEFIRQPYGWGNRFYPGSAKRSGQPDTFCTSQRQYSKVFSTQVTYNPKSFLSSLLTFEAWVLGHRVALLVPSSFRNKQCTASSSSAPVAKTGGNGHTHYRQADSEFYDAESDVVTKDFEEYDQTSYRLGLADEYARSMTTGSGYTAGYTVSTSSPTPFIGRATCRNFAVTGISDVTTCFNVTLEDGTRVASQCASKPDSSGRFPFSISVSLARSQVYSKYFIDPLPAVPGAHWIQTAYSCSESVATTTNTIATSDRAIENPIQSSSSNLRPVYGVVLAFLVALCALVF